MIEKGTLPSCLDPLPISQLGGSLIKDMFILPRFRYRRCGAPLRTLDAVTLKVGLLLWNTKQRRLTLGIKI
jgi:hypothetical protein